MLNIELSRVQKIFNEFREIYTKQFYYRFQTLWMHKTFNYSRLKWSLDCRKWHAMFYAYKLQHRWKYVYIHTLIVSTTKFTHSYLFTPISLFCVQTANIAYIAWIPRYIRGFVGGSFSSWHVIIHTLIYDTNIFFNSIYSFCV